MKKKGFILGMALFAAIGSYAGDPKKESCCKASKEAVAEQGKEGCSKGKSCCKKGEGKAAKTTKERKAKKDVTVTEVKS